MDTWLNWAQSIPNGPLIVLGLPAGPEAAGKPHYYFPPDKLASVYKVYYQLIKIKSPVVSCESAICIGKASP